MVKGGYTMKLQNLAEMQYVQIAKETVTYVLNEKPFISDVEIENTGLQRRVGDFRVVISFSDSLQDFLLKKKQMEKSDLLQCL